MAGLADMLRGFGSKLSASTEAGYGNMANPRSGGAGISLASALSGKAKLSQAEGGDHPEMRANSHSNTGPSLADGLRNLGTKMASNDLAPTSSARPQARQQSAVSGPSQSGRGLFPNMSLSTRGKIAEALAFLAAQNGAAQNNPAALAAARIGEQMSEQEAAEARADMIEAIQSSGLNIPNMEYLSDAQLQGLIMKSPQAQAVLNPIRARRGGGGGRRRSSGGGGGGGGGGGRKLSWEKKVDALVAGGMDPKEATLRVIGGRGSSDKPAAAAGDNPFAPSPAVTATPAAPAPVAPPPPAVPPPSGFTLMNGKPIPVPDA